jgi:hypothetical protein
MLATAVMEGWVSLLVSFSTFRLLPLSSLAVLGCALMVGDYYCDNLSRGIRHQSESQSYGARLAGVERITARL